MNYAEKNIKNIYSLFTEIGQNLVEFDMSNNNIFSSVFSSSSSWPNAIYDFNKNVKYELILDELNQNIENHFSNPIIFSIDNKCLDLCLKGNRYIPADQWEGMYREFEKTDDFSFFKNDLYIIKSGNNLLIEEWTELVSVELFNGKIVNKKIFEYLLQNGHRLVCLKKNNAIVATALIYVDRFNTPGIYMVCVKKNLRGLGYGKSILNFCLNILSEEGFKYCILQSTRQGRVLYLSQGFIKSNIFNLFIKRL